MTTVPWTTDAELEHLGVSDSEIERLRDADEDKRRKAVDRTLRELMAAPRGR